MVVGMRAPLESSGDTHLAIFNGLLGAFCFSHFKNMKNAGDLAKWTRHKEAVPSRAVRKGQCREVCSEGQATFSWNLIKVKKKYCSSNPYLVTEDVRLSGHCFQQNQNGYLRILIPAGLQWGEVMCFPPQLHTRDNKTPRGS